jgi:hypothetical protein
MLARICGKTGNLKLLKRILNSYQKMVSRFCVYFLCGLNFNPFIGVTEHPINENKKIVVLINYSADNIESNAIIKNGWEITNILYGLKPVNNTIKMKANDAIVLTINKN